MSLPALLPATGAAALSCSQEEMLPDIWQSCPGSRLFSSPGTVPLPHSTFEIIPCSVQKLQRCCWTKGRSQMHHPQALDEEHHPTRECFLPGPR